MLTEAELTAILTENIVASVEENSGKKLVNPAFVVFTFADTEDGDEMYSGTQLIAPEITEKMTDYEMAMECNGPTISARHIHSHSESATDIAMKVAFAILQKRKAMNDD